MKKTQKSGETRVRSERQRRKRKLSSTQSKAPAPIPLQQTLLHNKNTNTHAHTHTHTTQHAHGSDGWRASARFSHPNCSVQKNPRKINEGADKEMADSTMGGREWWQGVCGGAPFASTNTIHHQYRQRVERSRTEPVWTYNTSTPYPPHTLRYPHTRTASPLRYPF